MTPAPSILECTLRDGSYVVDFQFTAEFTARVCAALNDLGFPYIEIGHGVGLGASRAGYGVAAASDEQYMAVASGFWGMFCIPGIAELADIDRAADHGMRFIRIGCEVSAVEAAEPFIRLARERGLYVFSNLMKSYASPVDEFVRQAAKCVDYGAECVYVVDSAGGMLPNEIVTYGRTLRDARPEIKLGFHGHNNLGLGVGNALACAEAGFDVIDTSLQGIGRSGGNVPTEQIICALARAGFDVPHDPVAVMQVSEELIRPFMTAPGLSSLDVTAGYAQFHSSYMARVLAAAKRWRVDPRRLILKLCEYDRVNAPEVLIENCAASIYDRGQPVIASKPYYGAEQT